jgi:hypothetical protein
MYHFVTSRWPWKIFRVPNEELYRDNWIGKQQQSFIGNKSRKKVKEGKNTANMQQALTRWLKVPDLCAVGNL